MIVYFDTSALIPLIVEEDASDIATRLWEEADRMVSSRLIYAEARAALALARRIGRIDAQMLRSAVIDLDHIVADLDAVEVTGDLVHSAGTLAEVHGLRGYDALHLASALLVNDREVIFASGDKALLAAGASAGLRVARLGGV